MLDASLCLSLDTRPRHPSSAAAADPQAAGQAQAAELRNITRHAAALLYITASSTPHARAAIPRTHAAGLCNCSYDTPPLPTPR
jgi:hypothetical protein